MPSDAHLLLLDKDHVEGLIVAEDVLQAVREAFILHSGGGRVFPTVREHLGTHFNCVGADTKGKRELPDGLLKHARLFVDDRGQARQIGEAQWAPDQPCTELGELLSRTVSADRQTSDITIFDMTGLALQDLTVARLVHDRAVARGLGVSVAWPW
jgi:alanine dehydrogenase